MARILTTACLLVSSIMVAQAKPISLPSEIIKVREESFVICRDAGGRPSVKRGYIQAADFNGDGRPDYVVDDGELNCDGAPASFCGSGGCAIELYVSTPRGYRSANLQRLGFGATIKRSSSGPVLIVGGRNGATSYRWNGSGLQPVGTR